MVIYFNRHKSCFDFKAALMYDNGLPKISLLLIELIQNYQPLLLHDCECEPKRNSVLQRNRSLETTKTVQTTISLKPFPSNRTDHKVGHK